MRSWRMAVSASTSRKLRRSLRIASFRSYNLVGRAKEVPMDPKPVGAAILLLAVAVIGGCRSNKTTVQSPTFFFVANNDLNTFSRFQLDPASGRLAIPA